MASPSGTAWNATTSPNCTCATPTFSPCCTPRRSALRATGTTSNWTSSLGPNYLVTVHGLLNPVVAPEVALLDTALHPRSPFELSSADRVRAGPPGNGVDLIAGLAKKSGDLERQPMLGRVGGDSEPFLESWRSCFRALYELLVIRTIAVHSAATYDRMAKLVRSLPWGGTAVGGRHRGPLGGTRWPIPACGSWSRKLDRAKP
jgi:hypothetical protein